jgi:plasmid stabilization system protein ParE
MKVRYTLRGFADREDILAYFERVNPGAARQAKAFIKQRIGSLGRNPRRSRMIEKLGVHAHWLGRYP